MKSTKRFVLVLFLFKGFTPIEIHAQETTQYMAGFSMEGTKTLGDFNETHSMGYGAGVFYERGIGKKSSATIGLSYLNFFGKSGSLTDGNGNLSLIEYEDVYHVPIQVGGKYYFTEIMDGVYLKGEFGLHFYNTYEITSDTYGGYIILMEKTGSGFGFAPSIGFAGMLSEFSLRYQVVSVNGASLSYMSLKFGYILGQD